MKRLFVSVLVILLSVGCCFSWSLQAQNLDSLVAASLQFARQQLINSVAEIGDSTRFARSTLSDGSWKTKDAGSWASGFFPGCLWYMYQYTSEEQWKARAERWTAGMKREQYDTGTHDVGFKIFCSFGNGYRITQSEAYKEVIIQGARSLATRFNSTVGCIRSWNNRTFPVIIDNMMNLEILFWASKNGGDSTWYDLAVSHALKTMENNVREDGSTFQIVDYNPSTGAIINKETHQGYKDNTTWSRGQSWGLYGFTMTFRETEDVRFLETAQKIADYVLDNLPEDYVPYWDYEAPNIPDEEKDVSAAAIAASGLLELSTLVPDLDDQLRYRAAADSILASLCTPDYLATAAETNAILLHGVGNRPRGTEVDVSLIYADYYFIEALIRYMEMTPATIVVQKKETTIPRSIELLPNYPNPFNAETVISYRLYRPAKINLGVYDATGRLMETLQDAYLSAGRYRLRYNPSALTSGVYLIVLNSGKKLEVQKMTLIK